jgi:hypothetical protein
VSCRLLAEVPRELFDVLLLDVLLAEVGALAVRGCTGAAISGVKP